MDLKDSDLSDKTETRVPYILCLGGSAGALHALEGFLSGLVDTDFPISIIVAFHVHEVESAYLIEVLQKLARISVRNISDGLPVESKSIYVLPSAQELKIVDGRFALGIETSRMPIDQAMSTVAQNYTDKSIGVIFSGAGTDGRGGAEAIHNAGGLVIVQDPDTASQPGLPQSTIDSGSVSLVLPPAQMFRQICKWIQTPDKSNFDFQATPRQDLAFDLHRVLFILKNTSGHDFTLYKKNTIQRRLEKRMVIQGLDSLSSYVRFLEDDPAEQNNLLKDILIGVTSFFRDPEAFESLKNEVVPHLLENLATHKALRVWVPGCSTGQEAYSLAMVLVEACSHLPWDFDIKIFASDIDKEAIEFAREGRYPHAIAREISEERLNRFFIQTSNGFLVKKELKDRIIFAHHNVTRDPPFSKLDMISCRNLMIYLEPILQQKVLRIFHYALSPNGILFLGNSETVGDSSALFGVYDKRWKFFERKETVAKAHRRGDFEAFRDVTAATPEPPAHTPIIPRKLAIREISHDVLLQEFVPPTIVCDEHGEILFIHGRTGRYLEPAPGEARFNLFTMAKPEIRLELSRGFQKASSTKQNVRYADLRLKRDGEQIALDITIRVVNRAPSIGNLFVVTFEEESAEPILPENNVQFTGAGLEERSIEIERELLFTREHMQTLVEQLETSNEELKSMNEELQSSNEELQSSNEELETAKEELQAVNEELVTLNAELQEKFEELSATNSDLDNFLSASSMATLFLDRQYNIKRYSRSTTRIFSLIPSDVGRFLGDIASQLKYDDVLKDAEDVLETLRSIEKQVELRDGSWLSMRITPYKSATNVIDGVVIGFSDISHQRRLEYLIKLHQYVSESILLMLLIADDTGKIIYVSPTLAQRLGYTSRDLTGVHITELGLKQEDFFREETRGEILDEKIELPILDRGKSSVHMKVRIISVQDSPRLTCMILNE